MTVEFTQDRLERFKKIVAKYEVPASAILPALYLAEEQFGYLSPPVIEYVAGLVKMPPAQAFEVVSFYFMFKKKDMGRWCLQVCNNITCHMMGSEGLIRVIKEDLGIGVNEVTSDGLFSYLPVQCLGSCDTAPVCSINDEYFENLTPESFRELLKKMKLRENREAAPSQGKGEVATT
jgi:NADH-quinone oxidoreductase E subunit